MFVQFQKPNTNKLTVHFLQYSKHTKMERFKSDFKTFITSTISKSSRTETTICDGNKLDAFLIYQQHVNRLQVINNNNSKIGVEGFDYSFSNSYIINAKLPDEYDLENEVNNVQNHSVSITYEGGVRNGVSHILFSKNLMKLLHQCDLPVHIIPLGFRPNFSNSRVGHQNILIVDRIHRIIERFEPNGIEPWNFYNHEELDDWIREKIVPALHLLDFRYLSPEQWLCPKLGPQTIETSQKFATLAQESDASNSGYCVAHCALMGHLRIEFPKKSTLQLTQLMLETFSAIELLDLILRYTSYVENLIPDPMVEDVKYQKFIDDFSLYPLRKLTTNSTGKEKEHKNDYLSMYQIAFSKLEIQMKAVRDVSDLKQSTEEKIMLVHRIPLSFPLTIKEVMAYVPWPGQKPFIEKLKWMQKLILEHPAGDASRGVTYYYWTYGNFISHKSNSVNRYFIKLSSGRILSWNTNLVSAYLNVYNLKPDIDFYDDIMNYQINCEE